MRIFVYQPEDRSRNYMSNMTRVLIASLKDLGHEVNLEKEFYQSSFCESAIFVRKPFDDFTLKNKDVRNILWQIELYEANSSQIEGWYSFGWDEIWDSNRENNRGDFLPIGYHPCLRFNAESKSEKRFVGLLGGNNNRRKTWNINAKNKFEIYGSFDFYLRGLEITATKINLNLHAYDSKNYVEWDRICHFFANDRFFITEKMPIDIYVPFFSTVEEYDRLVDEYAENDYLRKSTAESMGKRFRQEYDMRKLLEKLL